MSAVLEPVLRLRPMQAGDLAAVMEIETAVYPFPWTPGNFGDSLSAGYECWLYLRDEELIGYAVMMIAADEAHLLNLSISAPRQRQGYGTSLLLEVCALARARGARLLMLEVRPSNVAAQRLYERQGLSQIGVRRDYYPASAGREDALIMSKAL